MGLRKKQPRRSPFESGVLAAPQRPSPTIRPSTYSQHYEPLSTNIKSHSETRRVAIPTEKSPSKPCRVLNLKFCGQNTEFKVPVHLLRPSAELLLFIEYSCRCPSGSLGRGRRMRGATKTNSRSEKPNHQAKRQKNLHSTCAFSSTQRQIHRPAISEYHGNIK